VTKRRDFLKTLAVAPAVGFAIPSGPGFRLGSITYNVLKDHDLDGVIRILEATGFEGVELRTGHKHGVEPSLSAADRARVRKRFANSKVRLVGYGTTCEFHSPDAAERNRQVATAKEFVDLARDTGAMGVKVRPNDLPAGVPEETTIANIGACLRELGEYGASRRVEIWLEVHGRKTSVPTVAAAIMKATKQNNAGLCWNSNNADIVNGSVESSFRLLQPWIRHVHIHELLKDDYPYQELFGLLSKASYDRYTMCEVGAGAGDAESYLRAYRNRWLELTGSR
jgi:sugar phosphate isomerase/epimerase